MKMKETSTNKYSLKILLWLWVLIAALFGCRIVA